MRDEEQGKGENFEGEDFILFDCCPLRIKIFLNCKNKVTHRVGP